MYCNYINDINDIMYCNLPVLFWQIAIATLLLNLSIAFTRLNDEPCQAEAVATLSLILPLLPDPEAMFRGLVALGTIIHSSPNLKEEIPPDTISSLRRIEKLTSDNLKAKVAACSSQILALFNRHVSIQMWFQNIVVPFSINLILDICLYLICMQWTLFSIILISRYSSSVVAKVHAWLTLQGLICTLDWSTILFI